MSVEHSRFREVWVHAEGGQALCALINGDFGFLMYLRNPEDAGFTSRNPRYVGTDDEMLEYVLSNGQRDEYPRAWALPISEVERALDFFRRTHEPPPFIAWHNDSGDGARLVPPG